MSDRYIRYEDAIKVIDKHRCRDDSCRICGYREECRTPAEKRDLKKLAVEETPVRLHGYWKKEPYLFGWTNRCNLCGENYGMPHGTFRFCPNCGAKMDGEQDA